jgi:hypothetical protein
VGVAMGGRAMSGCRRDRVHLLFMSVSFGRQVRGNLRDLDRRK